MYFTTTTTFGTYVLKMGNFFMYGKPKIQVCFYDLTLAVSRVTASVIARIEHVNDLFKQKY